MKGLTRQQLLEAGKKKLQAFREQKKAAEEATLQAQPTISNNGIESTIYENGNNNLYYQPQPNLYSQSPLNQTSYPQGNGYFGQNGNEQDNYNYYDHSQVGDYGYNNSSIAYTYEQPYNNYDQGAINNQQQDYVQPPTSIANAYASLSDAYLGSTTGATMSTNSSFQQLDSISNSLSNLNLVQNDPSSESYLTNPRPASPIIKEISLSTSFLPQNFLKSGSSASTPREIPQTIPEQSEQIQQKAYGQKESGQEEKKVGEDDFSLGVEGVVSYDRYNPSPVPESEPQLQQNQQQESYDYNVFNDVQTLNGYDNVNQNVQQVGDGETDDGEGTLAGAQVSTSFTFPQDAKGGQADQGAGGSAPLLGVAAENGDLNRGQPGFLSSLEQSRVEGYRQQIKELQRFVDELTQEKYELLRGLEKQNDITTNLATEQAIAGERLIAQQQENEILKQSLQELNQELQASKMAHLAASAERDAARQAVEEAQQRARELAAEIVNMEDNVQRSQLDVANREKGLDGVKKQVTDLENKLKSADKTRKGLSQQIEQLQIDKKNLMNRLRDLALSKGIPESAVLPQQFQQTPDSIQQQNVLTQNACIQTDINALQQQIVAVSGGGLQQNMQITQPNQTELLQQALDQVRAQQPQQQVPKVLEDLSEFFPDTKVFTLPEQISQDQQTVLEGINKLVDTLEEERQQLVKYLRSKDTQISTLKQQNDQLKQTLRDNQIQMPTQSNQKSHSVQQQLNTLQSEALVPIRQSTDNTANNSREVTSMRTIQSSSSLDIPPVSWPDSSSHSVNDSVLLPQQQQSQQPQLQQQSQQSEIEVVQEDHKQRQQQSRGWSLWGRSPDRAKKVSQKI